MPDLSSPTTAPLSQAELLAPLDAPLELAPVPRGYRFGLFLVAVVLVLLVAVYVALVAALGAAVWYHLGGPLPDVAGYWLSYLPPVLTPIIGGIALLFLIKPLFAPRAKKTAPVDLDPAAEPSVFALVDALCRKMRAPIPRRITVTCEANAAAKAQGWPPWLFINKVELVIGLPLVLGLDLDQFVGVLAHELAHFSQGSARRVSGLIRSINGWFAQVTYGRDAWDERLERASRAIPVIIGHPVIMVPVLGAKGTLYLARLFIWLTRRLLAGLTWIGCVVSANLSRQMEYDADLRQARIVGGETAARALDEAFVLQLASSRAYEELGRLWASRRLVDDLPGLVENHAARLRAGPEALAALRAAAAPAKPGLFDTHPSDAARRAGLLAAGDTGIFHVEAPASGIFRDSAGLRRRATIAQYRAMLDDAFEEGQLIPTMRVLDEHTEDTRRAEILARNFPGGLLMARPIFFGGAELLDPVRIDLEQQARLLSETRARMLATPAEAGETVAVYAEATGQLVRMAVAGTCLDACLLPDPKAFGLGAMSYSAVSEARQQAQDRRGQAEHRLEPIAEAARRRLRIALRLLTEPSILAGLDGQLISLDRCRALLAALAALEGAWPSLEGLEIKILALELLLAQLPTHGQKEGFCAGLFQLANSTLILLDDVRQALKSVPYPYEHGAERLTVAGYVMGDFILPESHEVGALYNLAGRACRLGRHLYDSILADLVGAAEAVEDAVGLPAMVAPTPESADAEWTPEAVKRG